MAAIDRPARLGSVAGRMHLIRVATVRVQIAAPPDRIERALVRNARGEQGGTEWSTVLEERDGRLLCDFETTLRLPFGRSYSFLTRETVEFDPPGRLHYRHRSGPSRGLAETISIKGSGTDGPSHVVYRATYPSPWRLWGFIFAFAAKPVAHLFMRLHFRELRQAVEST